MTRFARHLRLIKKSLASLEQQNQNPDGSEPEPEEPPKVQTRTWLAITTQEEIPLLLGIPEFNDDHDAALTRMAKVLVQRGRSAEWLRDMVKWMKEHKKFWAQRLHTETGQLSSLPSTWSQGHAASSLIRTLCSSWAAKCLRPAEQRLPIARLCCASSQGCCGYPGVKFERSRTKAMGMPTIPLLTLGAEYLAHAALAAAARITAAHLLQNVSAASVGRSFDVEEA